MRRDEQTSHEAYNREEWNRRSDDYQSRHGPQIAAGGGAAWGVWQLPESEIGALGEVRDLDVLEFGCGAAQWSIALHTRGARTTGLDISERQLEHARMLMKAAAVEFPLVQGSAESTPFEDRSFDLVFCDHGAMTFADPYRTVPEAARILREWIRLFAEHELVIESLVELRPPADATSSYRDESDRAWARRWPMEHIWRVRRAPRSR